MNPNSRPWLRQLCLVAGATALALAIGACGKKADPEPPDGKTDEFPRQYPDPSSL